MGAMIPSTSALMWVRAVDLSTLEMGRRITFFVICENIVLRTLTATRFVMVVLAFFVIFLHISAS